MGHGGIVCGMPLVEHMRGAHAWMADIRYADVVVDIVILHWSPTTSMVMGLSYGVTS